MSRTLRLLPLALLVAFAAILATAPDAGADDRKLFVGFREIPYVFILFDNTSSMASVTECTQEDLDAGFCSQLCDVNGGGCMAPLNADDPASKLYEAKQILYEVLLETENVDFGFATFNQDDLRVRRKHWLYQAATAGPTLPNSNPSLAYPAVGQQEVFGPQWLCDSGSDVGCGPQNDAADLDDPCDDFSGDVCDSERVRRLPRGDLDATGLLFDATTTFYVAQGSRDYRIDYGIPQGLPGGPSVTALVTVCESNNGGQCTGTVNSATVTYTLVDEFLSCDLGPDPQGNDQFEEFEGVEGFFAPADNLDVLADTGDTENGVGECGGLDMNDDTDDDIYVDPYNLRWPTIAGGTCSVAGTRCTLDSECPAGESCDPAPLLDVGDFIPLDWTDSHKQLILSRLAPNLLLGEGSPDFSIARYFENPAGTGPNGALELLDPGVRPILPTAKTPLDSAIGDFREWYDGCRHQPNCAGADDGWEEYAATRDPNWGCRKKYLLIFTDGDVTCQEGGNACNATANMNSQLGVETFVVAYGTSSDEQQPGGGNQSTLTCLPANSGAGQGQEIGALFPHNRQELLDALKFIFSAIVGRTATFTAAAVPSVQAEALDKLFLTTLAPVNEHSVWPGRLDAFLKPLPLDDENRPDTNAACDVPSNNDSNCHLWNAADVMLATQVDASDPVGQAAGKRRVAYAEFPVDASVPWVRQSFENSANRTVGIEVERDFWRGLGIQFVPGDTASENAARLEADAVVDATLAAKTGTLPPPDETEITYIMGEIFHSDPAVIGSPTNNNYFISNAGVDDVPGNDPDPSYRDFFFEHQRRRKVLGAGSNDGMFHLWDAGAWRTDGDFDDRFDNGSGKEILAYTPRTVLPVVKRMTEEPIAPQYAVDGRPAAADVLIDPIHAGTPNPDDREWRTVLMGGLRSGGWPTQTGFSHLEGPAGSEAQKAAGYFLLDLTQPDPIDPDFVPQVEDPPACLVAGEPDCGPVPYGTALWEFTDTILGEREEGDPAEESDNVVVGVRLDEDANGFIDLAPTWSTPNFGRLRVCVGGEVCNVAIPPAEGGNVEERHVAVFGGGLDENELSFHARGNFLYIVDVETGKTLYKRQLDGAAPSEPAAVDTNFDGFLDTIYIGTTYGFLHRVDLEKVQLDGSVLAPKLAPVAVSGVMADGTLVTETQQRIIDPEIAPHILFNANDVSVADVIIGVAGGTLRPQQMYFRPSVIFVPDLDRYALAFGTGNRADLFDRGETAGGRFFVLVDDVTKAELQDPAFTPLSPFDIQEVALTEPRRTDNLLVDVGGWWFRLAANQRTVTESFALSGILFFSSFIPADQAIIVEGIAPGPNPPQRDDFFCREAGTSQIFASLATNGNGLLYVPDVAEAVRFRTVEDLATRPYTELSQTANPVPDEPPPPLTAELLQIQEELKELFPPNCKFPPGYHIGVKTRVTDTGIEFIAPVPICVIEKNFRDY